MTYEEMIALLPKGGVNVKTFDRNPKGGKTLELLHREAGPRIGRDCNLSFDPQRGRIMRQATSVKLSITARTPTGDMVLLETSRKFLRGPARIGLRSHALSETLKILEEQVRQDGEFIYSPLPQKTEPPLNGVLRCLGEELHLFDFDPSELKDVSRPEEFEHPDIHESSVYPGILSCERRYRYEWVTDKIFSPNEKGPVITDSGTTILLGWFPREILFAKWTEF